jgi:hypothetical protein
MQLAILLVLILIAVLIAPWLLGVIVVVAAAYGVYLVALGAAAFVGIIAGIAWVLLKNHQQRDKPLEIVGDRRSCRNCQCEMPVSQTICSNCGFESTKAEDAHMLQEFHARTADIKSYGDADEGHYTDSVERIKDLKREGKNVEAIQILLKCVDATEKEARYANSLPVLDEQFFFLEKGRSEHSWGVAPWYYEQLAILYRKEKQYQKEVEILERYEKHEKAPGVGPQKLADRLVKARELARKNA